MDGKTKQLRDDYMEWVLSHEIADTEIYEKSPDHYRFDSAFAVGELNFYDLEMYVAELRITDTKTDDTSFFLHFELNDLGYAKNLFGEFLDTYETLRVQKGVRVLLSCTSAITTSFMANKLNDTAKLLGQDYRFSAVSFPMIYEKAANHNMILLAPQMASETVTLAATLPDTPVLDIPPRLFATYDAPAVLEFVRSEWQKHLIADTHPAKKKSLENVGSDASILAIVLLPEGKYRFRIIYRYYKNGAPVFDETVVKGHLHLVRDLCDILDTAVYRYAKYDIIGITLSGIPRGGHLDLPDRISPDMNLSRYLQERYHVPVVLRNNVNTAALGFHARHPHYDNLAFLSLPPGYRFGGVGSIVNGTLAEGSHGVAGEVKFLQLHKYGEVDSSNFTLSPRETLEVAEEYVRSVIALLDPEMILIRSRLIPDTKPLEERLGRYIPKEYMPTLRKVSDGDSLEYMLLGTMLSCVADGE